MRTPIHARDLFGVEAHLLVERAAPRVEHAALDRAPQPVGVDDQAAVVRAHEPRRVQKLEWSRILKGFLDTRGE